MSDEEILAAYKALADHEGVFAEPASAASVAGLIKLKNKGYFKKASAKGTIRVVCTLTGHGLKDPDRAMQTIGKPMVVKADFGAVCEALGYKIKGKGRAKEKV